MVIVLKNPSAIAGDVRHVGSVLGWKITWRKTWQPIPVFLLENPMDKGAWWPPVHRVTESDTTEAT